MIFLGRKNKFLRTQGKSRFGVSFNHAMDGIEFAINHERNLKIEIFMGICVSVLGFILNISIIEWMILILVIAMVICLELINTAIERAVDLTTKEYRELAKAAKDVSAGAVLVMSMFSIIIGILIFLPKLLILIK
ncbi:MAG: diacylglycerol kinase family protein [Bacilli bacterium]|nr:diacylglycerol kinase family protein [Bacilli bacterium]